MARIDDEPLAPVVAGAAPGMVAADVGVDLTAAQ